MSDVGSEPKKAGTTLGGYELLGKIGQGAMGAVFRARQTSMDRVVALKVLPQRLAKNKEFVARFLREARSAGRLNQPCIVQAFDAGEADGYYYIAMEYVDGPCLDDLLETDGALPEKQALEIARDIAKALKYAHATGLIHRDVKPANILLTLDWDAKLADLGLARESMVDSDSSLTNIGVALGTPDYMSPEQVRGEGDIDGRCDIYSLGATLYHLLAGSAPFKGGTRAEVMSKHLTESLPNPRRAAPDISAASAAIIRKAMAKKRDARYADASVMLAAIEAAIEGLSAAAAGSGTGGSTALSRAREQTSGPMNKKLLCAAGAVAAVAIAGVCIALFAGPEDGTAASSSTGNPRGTAQKPPATPKKTPAEMDAERLAAVRQWAGGRPNEYDAVINKYRAVIAQLTTPGLKSDAEAELQALERKRAAAAEEAKAALAAARSRAAALAKAGDYDGAIGLLNDLPRRFPRLLGNSAGEAAAQFRAEADAKVLAALDEAGKLGAARRFTEALERLKQLGALRYAPASSRIRQQESHLRNEQKRLAEAGREQAVAAALVKVGTLLDQIDATAEKNPQKAKQLAEAALKDPALKPAGDALTAAARVGVALGTFAERRNDTIAKGLTARIGQRIALDTKNGKKSGMVKSVTGTHVVLDKSFKIGNKTVERPDEIVLITELTGDTLEEYSLKFDPKTPDERIAAVILAMAGGDKGAITAALKGAEGHPLHKRYAARLAAQQEGSAKAAWRPLAPYVAKTRLTAAEIKKTAPALRQFEKDHGTTAFAASKRDAIAHLYSLLSPVFTKWPFNPAEARRRQKETSAALGIPVTSTVRLVRGASMQMVLIPAGEFVMGSPETEPGRGYSEGPLHRVRITKPFYMGRCEVTQEQWQRVTGKTVAQQAKKGYSSPSLKGEGNTYPIHYVSWVECNEFINKLNTFIDKKFTVSLPTEAEWEYACRAGSASMYSFTTSVRTLGDYAWYGSNSAKRTHPVGLKRPNAWGLRDMHGNVLEWVSDIYSSRPYVAGTVTDPKGPTGYGSYRVQRGGSWSSAASGCRSAKRLERYRTSHYSDVGFRIVLRLVARKK